MSMAPTFERGEVFGPVGVSVERTRQRGLKQDPIPQPLSATELRQLLFMDRHDEIHGEPNRLRHFANSRSAFR